VAGILAVEQLAGIPVVEQLAGIPVVEQLAAQFFLLAGKAVPAVLGLPGNCSEG